MIVIDVLLLTVFVIDQNRAVPLPGPEGKEAQEQQQSSRSHGTYKVTASLGGFLTLAAEEVRVFVGKGTDFSIYIMILNILNDDAITGWQTTTYTEVEDPLLIECFS